MLSHKAKRFALLREAIRILKRIPYFWTTKTNCGSREIVYRSPTESVWNFVRSDLTLCISNNPFVSFL